MSRGDLSVLDYAEQRPQIGDWGHWLMTHCVFCEAWTIGVVIDLKPASAPTIAGEMFKHLLYELGQHHRECAPNLRDPADVARWLDE